MRVSLPKATSLIASGDPAMSALEQTGQSRHRRMDEFHPNPSWAASVRLNAGERDHCPHLVSCGYERGEIGDR